MSPPPPPLLIATKNAHKTAEFREMLGGRYEVSDLNAFPELASPEETGATFAANAEIKALAAARVFPGLVLADDSGLEVDALGGEPGVRSARYAGEQATDADNRARLLQALSGQPQRTARFRCVLALARDGEVVRTFSGAVEGTILEAERGDGGFGYDSLFVPEGHEETFAQLTAETKNRLSHRARAMAEALGYLEAAPRSFSIMRRFCGLFVFSLGLILSGWIAYNLLIERLPETRRHSPLGASVVAVSFLYVGYKWMLGRQAG